MAGLDAYFDSSQTDWADFYREITSPQTRTNVNNLRLQAASGTPRRTAYDPSVGRYDVYNPTPYLPGDPNRLPPGQAGIDIPGRQPTRTALAILPFENQGNVRDPGNVDPFGSDFGFDDPALNPPTFPGAKPQQSAPRTAVATKLDVTPVLPQRAQTKAGYEYTRNSSGGWDKTGKADWTAGLTPHEQYAKANGKPVDNSYKEIGPSGSDQSYYEKKGFGSERAMIAAYNQYAASAGLDPIGPKDRGIQEKVRGGGFSDWLRSSRTSGARQYSSTSGGQTAILPQSNPAPARSTSILPGQTSNPTGGTSARRWIGG